MKKMRSLLAVLLCVAMLASLSLVASADTTCTKVESVLDFTAMPRMAEDVNKADIAAYIIGAGAVAAENLLVAGNHENIANPGGYQGWGYFVQKVTAAAGETIQNAKLNLGYWLIDSANPGMIELYVSSDNANWQLVASDNQGNGGLMEATRKEVSLDLPFAPGQTELYVMLKMAHWDTYEGAGVAYSKITINDPAVAAEPKTESVLDFTAMPRMAEDVNKADIAAYIIGAGAVAAENLLVAGNHENIANPGGYQGWGWFIQKVTVPEGETMASAALELSYRMCNGDPLGIIEVYVSADNVNYEKIWETSEGHGNPNEDIRQDVKLDLPVAENQTEVYVKVNMAHWNTYEGAGVAYSKLSIALAEAPEETEPADPSEPANPKTGDVISAVVALALVCAAGIVITGKKYRK